MSTFVHEQLRSRVVFGAGAFRRLPEEVAGLGATRVVIVATRSMATTARDAGLALGAIAAGRVIDRVRQHVPQADVVDACSVVRSTGADCVVSIGGGSATGLAKGIALETGVPLVAVPTTYSGSEMTPVYGITRAGEKRTGRDLRVLPKTVVYDPRLTIDLDARVTAASGMNALAHCVEAMYAPDVGPVVQLLAIEGIRALHRGLPKAVEDGSDMEARGDCLYGAWLGGSVSAQVSMGVHHTLCHVLGGRHGVDHGGAHSVLLPHVVAFNSTAASSALARVAHAIGSDSAAAGIYDFASTIGAPRSLAELGVDRTVLADVAHVAADRASSDPRAVDEEGLLEVLDRAHEGRRPPG